ncbi:anhydrase family 3 protein [Sulfobacillus acidophilus TPY]|uniref:Anhydrase family 3 protein n=1 Tax=Sulfobacillus acidophilus (strain ATCC 700253 / DSM 10332 / NAL) TaxID=679936 RepID=G8TXU8_SULAD|nr:anhydrase family 3 protein [Sulfobacillus acidophilus TPY]AEW06154.1 anhydrase family 3 protein [Sulfobacillus acidophilus DSM 10332]
MLLDYEDQSPVVDPPVFLAPGSYVIGRVALGPHASVWFNAVIRGDLERIEIGARTNIQDNVVIHADPGFPVTIGDEVTVGHGAIIHGARVESRVLIGMGSIIMNGAVIGDHSIIGAGTLIPEGAVIAPGSLVLGRPGKRVRSVTEDERAKIVAASQSYVQRWLSVGWHFQ